MRILIVLGKKVNEQFLRLLSCICHDCDVGSPAMSFIVISNVRFRSPGSPILLNRLAVGKAHLVTSLVSTGDSDGPPGSSLLPESYYIGINFADPVSASHSAVNRQLHPHFPCQVSFPQDAYFDSSRRLFGRYRRRTI